MHVEFGAWSGTITIALSKDLAALPLYVPRWLRLAG
jgi:hypothetical protein